MNLLIVDGPFGYNNNPRYRGTDRSPPRYHEELDPSHPANRAWIWLAEEASGGVVHDLMKAREIVDIYRHLAPLETLEIVEVTRGKSALTTKGRFLGFDLSHGFANSLISGGIAPEAEEGLDNTKPSSDIRQALQPLLRLMGEFFMPHLNAQGLVDDYDTAYFWLQCIMALQTIQPGLFEFGDYEVVGVWEVDLVA